MHQELAAPTVINHSLCCNFTNPNRLNLIVAKGNLLAIYRIYTTKSEQPYPTARMEFIHEFTLQGIITSMSSIRTGTSVGILGMDSLLLTFKDAKVRSY
jgi:hypothetical protein